MDMKHKKQRTKSSKKRTREQVTEIYIKDDCFLTADEILKFIKKEF